MTYGPSPGARLDTNPLLKQGDLFKIHTLSQAAPAAAAALVLSESSAVGRLTGPGSPTRKLNGRLAGVTAPPSQAGTLGADKHDLTGTSS